MECLWSIFEPVSERGMSELEKFGKLICTKKEKKKICLLILKKNIDSLYLKRKSKREQKTTFFQLK